LRRAGVEPHLAADPSRETGRLIAIVDPTGERSFLTDRGANDALEAADIPDALIDRADHIHISGYSLFAPSPREAVLSVMRRATRPVSVDPGSAEFLREVGAANFLGWTAGAAMLFPNSEEAAVLAGSDDAEAQGERLAALSARRDQARRCGLRGLARRRAMGASRRPRRRLSIRPVRGMLSWRRSSPQG
jgi:sugar/nucleoside kinase (ribokinase family)